MERIAVNEIVNKLCLLKTRTSEQYKLLVLLSNKQSGYGVVYVCPVHLTRVYSPTNVCDELNELEKKCGHSGSGVALSKSDVITIPVFMGLGDATNVWCR